MLYKICAKNPVTELVAIQKEAETQLAISCTTYDNKPYYFTPYLVYLYTTHDVNWY